MLCRAVVLGQAADGTSFAVKDPNPIVVGVDHIDELAVCSDPFWEREECLAGRAVPEALLGARQSGHAAVTKAHSPDGVAASVGNHELLGESSQGSATAGSSR